VKLVLDTNILLSAILVPGSCREFLRGQALAHDWYTSEDLLAELARVLDRKLSLKPDRTPLFLVYRRRARLVTPNRLPAPICRDPDDDRVIATALAAEADVVVTGDKDLLVLGSHQGIRMRTPRQFLDNPAG
jgi:uncharacterized protein